MQAQYFLLLHLYLHLHLNLNLHMNITYVRECEAAAVEYVRVLSDRILLEREELLTRYATVRYYLMLIICYLLPFRYYLMLIGYY